MNATNMTSQRIGVANGLLKQIVSGISVHDAQTCAAVALVQANLALVEQHRLSNLLTLFVWVDAQGDLSDFATELMDEINDGMGISARD